MHRYSRDDVSNGVFHAIDATNENGELVVGDSIGVVGLGAGASRSFGNEVPRLDSVRVVTIRERALRSSLRAVQIVDVHVKVVLFRLQFRLEFQLFTVTKLSVTVVIVTREHCFDFSIGITSLLQLCAPFVELETTRTGVERENTNDRLLR